MEDFEKLGVFYLGRTYDLVSKSMLDDLLLYDSKDLVTHAVCVGMTGSGKTGLCICLLEEAALDRIPSIVIDPKGDITNLLLTFPDLRAEDFAPWVNAEDAMKKGLSPEDYAAKQAEAWRNGLASWGEDGARIRKLRDTSSFVIYTPGSNAGVLVSILRSFAAPPKEVIANDELLQERVNTTVTSLLGLIGIQADPIKSREHILISTVLSEAWTGGADLDLAGLIQRIQNPPFRQVGVLELESFYPSNDRFALATQLNNLLAAPGFRLWLEGELLDVGRFLYGPDGKPRVSIFSIAHLSDAERMFFVSLLLNHVVGWMRTQSGTTSLRSILYIDEVFGYLPPVANPPSKLPLLTLMKQARAFGLGVVLVTQNPVDLDYKGLSNTGTWFIGRLQTDRDKMRVLDALEGVVGSAGKRFSRGEMEAVVGGLGNRVFLMYNVHEDAPVVFSSRWAMSYLRGPLTRSQIKTLIDPIKSAAGRDAVRMPSSTVQIPKSITKEVLAPGSMRPVLPSEIPQYFLPPSGGSTTPVYRPMAFGIAEVRFVSAKNKVDEIRDIGYLAPISEGPVPINWEAGERVSLSVQDLRADPLAGASYSNLPAAAAKPKNYSLWQKDFIGWIARNEKIELFRSPSLNEQSRPGESESDFRIRMQLAARELADQNVEKLRQKYAPKYASLDERIRKARIAVEKEQDQTKSRKYQTAVSFGSTLLGAVLGRRVSSSAGRTARDMERVRKEKKDVEFAGENLEALQKARKKLEEDFQAEVDAMGERIDPLTEKLEVITISPTKTNVSVRLVALVWKPQS